MASVIDTTKSVKDISAGAAALDSGAVLDTELDPGGAAVLDTLDNELNSIKFDSVILDKQLEELDRMMEEGDDQSDGRTDAFQEIRERRWKNGVNLGITLWIVSIHMGALAAPFFFSWQAIVLVVFLHWLTGGIGICLGYHRLFTHRSFSTFLPIRWLIAMIGGLAGEGSVIDWVSNHRKHHALSDHPGDPHSPHEGAWWSHMIWFMPSNTAEEHAAHNARWSPDLVRDPVLKFLDRAFIPSHFLLAGILFAIGYAYGGAYYGLSFMFWGVFVRLLLVLHATWLVNSASHMWGYRTYETRDDSRNNWWVAMVTYGEGWHNNHHAYPRMARAGHRWWEFDVTFLTIRLLEKVGLVWDVVDGQHKK